jgi:hypothetical protein
MRAGRAAVDLPDAIEQVYYMAVCYPPRAAAAGKLAL